MGFADELVRVCGEYPDDMQLAGAARTYIAAKGAFGLTCDPRQTASFAHAQTHYKRVTGAEWSGNP